MKHYKNTSNKQKQAEMIGGINDLIHQKKRATIYTDF